MFDIGWSELLVIGVVALIAIGPKELPGVLRSVGQWVGKIKRMAGEFQGQFQEAMREAEMADLKKHADDLKDMTKSLTSGLDPYDIMKDVAAETKTSVTPETEAATPEAAAAVTPDAGLDPSAPAVTPASAEPQGTPTPAEPAYEAPPPGFETTPTGTQADSLADGASDPAKTPAKTPV
jgi:sec-independent protein translocase protein TatB